MAEHLTRVDPFPPSPEGRKSASAEAIDLDAWAPNFQNFTDDRGDMIVDQVGEWDPAIVGAADAYRGFECAAQGPGMKKSKGRVSW